MTVTPSITKDTIGPLVKTSAISDSYLTSTETRSAWQHLIDFRLLDWATGQRQGDADDCVAPTMQAVHTAIQFARYAGFPAPTKCVGTGDGGIAFKWGQQGSTQVIVEIDEVGSAEFIHFENSKVKERIRLA